MSQLGIIRAAIVAKLASIPGIGKTHDHEPFINDQKKLKELYVQASLLKGWHVRRIKTVEVSPSVGRSIEYVTWEIRGFMAFDDSGASEIIFDETIEAIRDAFRAAETLGDVVAGMVSTEDEAFVQVFESQPVSFCGVTSHSARLRLTTQRFI